MQPLQDRKRQREREKRDGRAERRLEFGIGGEVQTE